MGVQSKLVKLWLLLLFAHRYPVEGIVVETHPEMREMVVAHRPIDNYMPAMSMTFQVGPEVDLIHLTPGSKVSFELEVGKRSSIARKVKIEGVKADFELPKAASCAIKQKMPPFSLMDQAGRTVQLADFLGKVVVVDFIYTRCPLPMCVRDYRLRSHRSLRSWLDGTLNSCPSPSIHNSTRRRC